MAPVTTARSKRRSLVVVALVALGAGAGVVALGAQLSACRDNTTRFSTKNDRYEGAIVKGSFVRSGLGDDVRMCMTFDGDRVQDAPGSLTTSDGRFRSAPLRPIPQIWHDPLSTYDFGNGRVQNLIYVATPTGDAGDGLDVMVFVSLMENGDVEVRLVRGAPQADGGASGPGSPTQAGARVVSPAPPLFGVFSLAKLEGACAF